jgi:hypothetical protein
MVTRRWNEKNGIGEILDEFLERKSSMSRHEVSLTSPREGRRRNEAMLEGFTDVNSLAYCELYIALAALVLRVFPHMKLFDTTVEDVQYHHDLFIPMTRPESLGVRVLIT